MSEIFKPEWPLANPLILNKRSHTIYKNKDGKRLQSVTTIIRNLGWSGAALQYWANEQGLKGKNMEQALKSEAEAGTFAHYYCECYIKRQRPDLSQIPQETAVEKEKFAMAQDKAQNAFIGFLDWRNRNDVLWNGSEIRLVSEENQFAGTIDAVGLVGDKLTLIDFKTAKGIYADHVIQVSAYWKLLLENKYDIKDVMILQLDKTDGTFMPHPIVIERLNVGWEVFKLLKSISPYKKVLDTRSKDDE